MIVRSLAWCFLLVLVGCASPTTKLDRRAQTLGFSIAVVKGDGFLHRAYMSGDIDSAKRVHIYLDGDGRPWLWQRQAADDPTPSSTLVLELMSQDSTASIYLGRPCYFVLERCDDRLWTTARYSPQVVKSMTAAVQQLLRHNDQASISLVGYSGGGALATLMVADLPAVDEVVTVAANLDIDYWVALHGYAPLDDSFNPIESADLAGVRHWHWVGGRDEEVRPEMARRFVERHGGTLREINDFDHRCCWADQWAELLAVSLGAVSGPSAR